LERPETLVSAVERGTDIVINCAAYTNVDGAETEPERAERVNGDGVGALAARCRQVGATLVHFSTDYVFDGRATAPYPVDHPVAPIGSYGRSKARGELGVRESGARHLLVRTSWLHAPWGKCFPRTILELARTRERLRVVDDQRGRPTFAPHLARATLDLVNEGAEGIFHVTDGGECTWYGFAREVVARAGLACEVEPCTTAEMPRPAPRPAYSVLALEATEALLGPMPLWTEHFEG
jgi:dTDP-4-dehydrorhamnose reductase